MADSYTLNPIGKVAVDDEGFALLIDEPFREALRGLEDFSHLHILFWCHFLDQEEYRRLTIADKPYRQGPDRLGIFATRSPARPNPIAVTAVPVLGIDHAAGVVRVAFIDAEPDTPILDIKPYLAIDRIRDITTPEWSATWPQWYEDAATFDWSAVFENAR